MGKRRDESENTTKGLRTQQNERTRGENEVKNKGEETWRTRTKTDTTENDENNRDDDENNRDNKSNENDRGPGPRNDRDDDENRREGLATLLRLREKRGNAERERGGKLVFFFGPVATTDIYILNSRLQEQKTLTKRKPIEEGGREGSH